MISIIISTYRPDFLSKVSRNLEETVGVPYEILAIQNNGEMGICSAYNIGAGRSKFDLLCFVHEDIEIKTQNWGKIVIDSFEKDENLGLLGVAGSLYKSLTPSHWSFPGASEETFVLNMIQRHKDNKRSHYCLNPNKEDVSLVAAIDGLWFCTKKTIVTEIPFDERTLTGFHGYDVDYSLSISTKYKVAVTLNILIEHFSEGSFDRIWIDDMIKVHKKWKDILPKSIKQYDDSFKEKEEMIAFKLFVQKMAERNYSFFEILKLFQFQNVNFRFNLFSKLLLFSTIIRFKYHQGVMK